jgi:hypothetical protein
MDEPADYEMSSMDRKVGTGILWVIGNIAGWLIGIGGALGAGIQVTDSLTAGSPPSTTPNYSGLVGVAAAFLLALILSAIMVSLAQWLVVRSEFSRGWTWLIATFFGILIGLGVAITIGGTFVGWTAFGAVVGILQWLVIRTKVNRAGNWILINVLAGGIGGSMGWILTQIFESRTVVSTMGVMFSAVLAPPIFASVITGIGLVWLLKQGPPIPELDPRVEYPVDEPYAHTSPSLSPSSMENREEAKDWLEDLLDERD